MEKMDIRESLTVKFKSDRKRISGDFLIEAVVAMANTDGGEIYLGVEDNGDITGLNKLKNDLGFFFLFLCTYALPVFRSF